MALFPGHPARDLAVDLQVVVPDILLMDGVTRFHPQRIRTDGDHAVVQLGMVVGANTDDVVLGIRAVVRLAQGLDMVGLGIACAIRHRDLAAADLALVLSHA